MPKRLKKNNGNGVIRVVVLLIAWELTYSNRKIDEPADD